MRGDERMDERMDAALRSYAEPGEIPEARVVVARVMELAGSEGRRSGWWWVVVPATACLLVALVGAVWMMRGARVPEIASVPQAPGVRAGVGAAESHPSLTKGASGKDEAPELAHAKGGRAQDGAPSTRLPKMEIFPTPRPLTAEEQALVAFTEQATPEVKKQVVEAEKHLGDPIAIAELKIRPLDEEDRQ
jgi:hypothetical protein